MKTLHQTENASYMKYERYDFAYIKEKPKTVYVCVYIYL